MTMLGCDQVEELIHIIRALDRDGLIDHLRSHPTNFPLDFTEEFLRQQSTERLRHIFMALCLHTQRMPELATPEAA